MNSKQAKEVLITEYLAYKNILPVRYDSHRPDYWYKSPFREEKTASFKCNILLNRWWDFGTGEGGNIIDLALKLSDQSVSEALKDIARAKGQIPFSFEKQNAVFEMENEPNPVSIQLLKIQSLSNSALLLYLRERAVEASIAQQYCYEVYYKLLATNKHYFSIGFKNSLGGFALRNKYFKNQTSPAGITAYFDEQEVLSVFEGFFDFLSWKQLYPNLKSDVIVLNSIVNIDHAEQYFQKYSLIRLYLDNDPHGKIHTVRLLSAYGNVNDQSEAYKGFKDLNEYLQALKFNKL